MEASDICYRTLVNKHYNEDQVTQQMGAEKVVDKCKAGQVRLYNNILGFEYLTEHNCKTYQDIAAELK